MTDVDDDDDDEEGVAYANEVYLQEETCWIADPDYLHRESGVQGVIAIQYKGGQLWYLDGETRQWASAEAETKAKPRGLRPVN